MTYQRILTNEIEWTHAISYLEYLTHNNMDMNGNFKVTYRITIEPVDQETQVKAA